jgi:hypothetical protein
VIPLGEIQIFLLKFVYDELSQHLFVLLQCVDALGVDLAGKPPGQCLWQLPAQLLHTS